MIKILFLLNNLIVLAMQIAVISLCQVFYIYQIIDRSKLIHLYQDNIIIIKLVPLYFNFLVN